MLYLILIKTYRWLIFCIFCVGLLYAGMANAADLDQVPLPYKEYVHAALGLVIVWHFGLIMYYRNEFGHVLFKLYMDDHYTVVRPGRLPESFPAFRFRQIEHEFDDDAEVKIYYNNPDGKPSHLKRIR